MTLNYYGLLISFGILVGLSISKFFQKKLILLDKTYSFIDLDLSIFFILPPALIGARLYHVIDYWQFYSSNLLEIFQIWHGGIGIYGAIVGGGVGAYVYYLFVKNKYPLEDFSFYSILDLLALALPWAQAIGRWGNYFNSELFGLPTNLPWAIFIEPQFRPLKFATENLFHPLFLYESILNFSLGCILIFLHYFFQWNFLYKLSSLQFRLGLFFYTYLFGYGCIRFFLDFLRIDPWKLGVLTTAQWISLLFILIGGGGVCRLLISQKLKK